MSPRKSMGWVAAMAGLACAGCSLVKLSDDIEIGRCEGHDDCEVLNDRDDPDFDPCFLWQCNRSEARCELSALDDDYDGYTPETAMKGDEEVSCEPEGEPDCFDDNPNANPGNSESCDDTDNDCDGRVDEGELRATGRPVISFTEDLSGGLVNVAYALDAKSGNIDVAYAIDVGMGLPGVSVVPADLGELKNAAALPGAEDGLLRGAHVGVAAMRSQALAVGLVNVSGVTRTVIGLSQGTGSAGDLTIDPGIRKYGLACLPTEDCSANVAGLQCFEEDASCEEEPMAIDAPASISVELASLADLVLATYLRANDSSSQNCGDDAVDASSKPRLLASLVRQRSGHFEEVDYEAGPIDLGETADMEPAAAIGVPAITLEDGEADVGFLLARVRDNGRVVLDRVWTDGGLQHETLVDLGSGPASQVRMTLGPGADGKQQVGIVHVRDCGVESRVLLHIVELSVDDDGALQAERIAGPISLHDGPSQSAPAVAYSGTEGFWAVAYRDPRGLRARVLERDGTVRNAGEAPYFLLEHDEGKVDTRLRPYLTAGTRGDAWFTALTPVERSASGRTIDAIELRCPPSSP